MSMKMSRIMLYEISFMSIMWGFVYLHCGTHMGIMPVCIIGPDRAQFLVIPFSGTVASKRAVVLVQI